MQKTKAFGGILISLLIFTSCETDFSVTKSYRAVSDHDPLTEGVAPTPSPAPTLSCQTVLQQTGKNLRILFMIDNSGSTDNSDPQMKYRVQTVRNFLQTYGSKPNLTYSFSYFAADTYRVDPTTLSILASSEHPLSSSDHPFGDANFLSQALSAYELVKAQPRTDYVPALTLLQNMISNDIAQDPKWDYVVVFLSDGGATDNHLTPTTLSDKVKAMRSMVSSKGHELTFSTVYFGAKESDVIQDPTAYYGFNISYAEVVSNLKSLATAGNGQFVDTNLNNGSLVIGDIISVPGEVCTYK